MSRTVLIPEGERGKLHLFALNGDPAPHDADGPDPRPADLLGMADLDPDFAEIIKVSDLDTMSLTTYLVEGYDVTNDSLAPHRARLNALSGHVLVVLSMAFRDKALSLTAGSEITHIASLETTPVDWQSAPRAATDPAPEIKKPSDAAMMGRVATIALLVLFLLTAIVVWISG